MSIEEMGWDERGDVVLVQDPGLQTADCRHQPSSSDVWVSGDQVTDAETEWVQVQHQCHQPDNISPPSGHSTHTPPLVLRQGVDHGPWRSCRILNTSAHFASSLSLVSDIITGV